jgi:hypothetical protein
MRPTAITALTLAALGFSSAVHARRAGIARERE